MLIEKAWKCLGYIVLYLQRRQHSVDIWWIRENDMFFIYANYHLIVWWWVFCLFFGGSVFVCLFVLCSLVGHTSVFRVSLVTCLWLCIITKTVSNWFWNWYFSSSSLLQTSLMDQLYCFSINAQNLKSSFFWVFPCFLFHLLLYSAN